jgi:hypothetical protein
MKWPEECVRFYQNLVKRKRKKRRKRKRGMQKREVRGQLPIIIC